MEKDCVWDDIQVAKCLSAEEFLLQKQKKRFNLFGAYFYSDYEISKIMEEYYQSRLDKIDVLYQFVYCECVWESGPTTISLHRTREGAEKAMKEHKEQAYKEWEEIWPTQEDREEYPFGTMESWDVREIKIED